MKVLKKILFAGALAAVALSTSWAAESSETGPPPGADAGKAWWLQSNNSDAERPSRPKSADSAPRGPARQAIVDLAVETASHEEVEPLDVKFERPSTLRLDRYGRLLAGDAEAKEIKLIDRCGRQVGTIEPGFAPEAIDVAHDGTIYCGGDGRLAMLDPCGNVLRTTPIPDDAKSAVGTRRRASSRPLRISGIAVSETDAFVAFGSGWSLGSKSRLFRFDRDLGDPQLLAEGLRGCCQRCDIVGLRGMAYLAENSAHRVVVYNRDGEVLDKWGARSRTDVEGFGSCCNPMNLCFDARGILYTAESGLGRVKRYATDGKYLGLVGYVGVERFANAGRLAASCSNIAIAVTPSGDRVYVMDYKNNLIRVLQKKKAKDVVPTVQRKRRLRLFDPHPGSARRAWRRR